MRDITIDFIANKIVVTKGFYENAKVPATEENEKLRAVMSDYPNMKVSVRETSRKGKSNAYKGLTYRYMREFVSVMDNENLDVFGRVILHFERMYAENTSKVYAAVRDWFLENYPNHEKMIVAAVPTRKAVLASVPVAKETAAAA